MGWMDALPSATQSALSAKTPTVASPSGSFWQSPAAGALIGGGLNAIGGLFSGKANAQQNADQLAQQSQQFERELAQRQAEFAAQQAQANQKMALEASQLNPQAQQDARLKSALYANILGNARNIQPPGDLAGYMPQGGLRIPEGGYGQDVMSFASPQARGAAEQDFFANTDSQPDLSRLGYGTAAPKASAKAKKSWYDSEIAFKQAQQRAMTGALNPQQSTIPKTANRNWLGTAASTAAQLAPSLIALLRK